MPRLSYAEQTAQMVKLLEELSSTENQNKLSALFLQPAYNEMQDTHEAFEILFAEQAQANAGLRMLTTASSIRKGLETETRTFLNFVTTMKAIPGWELYYNDLHELVKAAK